MAVLIYVKVFGDFWYSLGINMFSVLAFGRSGRCRVKPTDKHRHTDSHTHIKTHTHTHTHTLTFYVIDARVY